MITPSSNLLSGWLSWRLLHQHLGCSGWLVVKSYLGMLFIDSYFFLCNRRRTKLASYSWRRSPVSVFFRYWWFSSWQLRRIFFFDLHIFILSDCTQPGYLVSFSFEIINAIFNHLHQLFKYHDNIQNLLSFSSRSRTFSYRCCFRVGAKRHRKRGKCSYCDLSFNV